MNNTVYLYFNRPDPGRLDNWHDWQGLNPDEIKMAAVTAHSWQQNGWDVRRLTTETFDKKDWWWRLLGGRIAGRQHEYPIEFWQLIPMIMAKKLAPCWVTTCDILNERFTPLKAARLLGAVGDTGLVIPWADFTLAAFHITPAGCENVMKFVNDFDAGRLPDFGQNYSEEMICRLNMRSDYDYSLAFRHECGTPLPFAGEGWLRHFSRSIIPHYYNLPAA